MNNPNTRETSLGAYLKDRRAKLDPCTLGYTTARRRTPGLRREEVAERAHISPTWYTWLEQGRGGAPSPDVLERIAQALVLTDIEREHLFLLAFGRPPEAKYHQSNDVTPRLQRILNRLDPIPAIIRTAVWDVIAWNEAATVMLADYRALPVNQRNILRHLFLDPRARAVQYDWERVARFALGAFRVDVARAGAQSEMMPMVEELSLLSPEFAAMWGDNNVQGPHGDGIKRIHHPQLGPIAFEFTTFAVDGRTDLSMVVFNPATERDEAIIATRLSSMKGEQRR